MKIIFAILMAAFAYTLLSLGFVLQKKGIGWIGWKGKKGKKYFKNLFIWFSGFVIMNIYGIPSVIALKTLSPHLVSAFAGWGIVVIIFLSSLILGEKSGWKDFLYSFLIISGIIFLYLFENMHVNVYKNDIIVFCVLSLLPVFIFISSVLSRIGKKWRNFLFASTSGVFAGMMIVALKILVINFGYDAGKYFSSVFLYMYMLFAILSFISLQLAFKNGTALISGQLQYSFAIVYPSIASILVFANHLNLVQILSLILIIFSVIMILKRD